MRARIVVPLVVLCALAAAAPALADPHVSRAQSHMISNLMVRWVNDVVQRRPNPVVRRVFLADGWKIAGAAERGAISHKAWVSGKELPLRQMVVRNDPRNAWYVKWKSGNEIGLVEQLMTGRAQNRMMYDFETTLQERRGKWVVYGFYGDGFFRYGRGHSGSGVSSKNKVTGINDLRPGDAPLGGLGSGKPPISGPWRTVAVAGIAGIPFALLLTFGLVAFVRARQARRARLEYMASRTSST